MLDLFHRHRLPDAFHLFHDSSEFGSFCRADPFELQPLRTDAVAFQAIPQPVHALLRPAIRVDVMAIGIVATGDQRDRRSELERAASAPKAWQVFGC